MPKKILIIDSHPLIVAGLEFILQNNGDEVIKTSDECDNIFQLIHKTSPDIIIIDIYQSSCKYQEMSHLMKARRLNCSVVVFSEFRNLFFQKECYDMGVSAYVPKSADIMELMLAIVAVRKGKRYYSSLHSQLMPKPIKEFDGFIKSVLTFREQEVLKQLSAGYSVKEISGYFNLSIKTISTHKMTLIKKLGCRNLTHAINVAYFHEVAA